MTAHHPAKDDAVWSRLRQEAERIVGNEAMLAPFLHDMVLKHRTLEAALAYFLANKLASHYLNVTSLRDVMFEGLSECPAIGDAVRSDLEAVLKRDPAARDLAHPFLHFKGFHALQSYRIGHWLWDQGRQPLAFYLQSRIAEVFDVDIHPAARIGQGILIDHGTGVVIGETAVIGDNVSMLHQVTLGGTGKESGDRHPKIGHGVLIGAGAKVLGNIRVGDGSKIAAGSVVLNEVPEHSTVAGTPARVVGKPHVPEPALLMDQQVDHDYCI